jgi:two-component system, NarL family, sensor histidine kinase DegS
MANDVKQEVVSWTELKDRVQSELDQSRRELKEIALMLEQSQLEVSKLAQRNASISSHLQQVQSQFDTLPRPDIRMAYDSALDSQQRLFVMRGQVDKLQSDRTHLARYISLMESVVNMLEGRAAAGGSAHAESSTSHTVEMMVQAQESERQRLSRQMHDGPAQALSNFILQTEIAMRLFDLDQQKAREELENLKMAATVTFRKVRDFIFELRPMMLDDLGMVPTLKRYVDAWKDQTNLDARMLVTGKERRLEGYEEVMIFRAIQELLHNASRHSSGSLVKVQMDLGDTDIKVVVEDDGKGFDNEQVSGKSGMGLKLIQDRVEMLGGSMDIDSVVGQGTRVTFQIPALELQ